MTTPQLSSDNLCAKVLAWCAIERIWRQKAETEVCMDMNVNLDEFLHDPETSTNIEKRDLKC